MNEERDWRALPTDPQRVQRMAAALRQTYGKAASAGVRKWMTESSDTHMGIGIPIADVLAELVKAEQVPGYQLPPIPRQPSWSDAVDRIDDMKPARGRA